MNRQQRRKIERQNKKIKRPSYHGMTQEEKLDRLFQQGISLDDLKEEYENGYTKGFSDGLPAAYKTCYAAAVLALHDLYGFGHDRCYRVIRKMDSYTTEYLSSQEIIDEVYRKICLTLDFRDPIEPIKETDEIHPWRK